MIARQWRLGLTIAGLVAVAGIVTFFWLSPDLTGLVRAERRELVRSIKVEGTLEAVESAEFGPPPVSRMWNFKVSFMADEGSLVVPGDPVVGFDSGELEQRLVRYEIERDAAAKTIEKRTADFEIERREAVLALAEAEAAREKARLKSEVPASLVAAAQLEKAGLDFEIAEADVRYTTAKLEAVQRSAAAEIDLYERRFEGWSSLVQETRRQIDSMTVVSTQRGTVIHKIRRGEKKKVGDSSWRGEIIVEIPDLDRMRVAGQVSEADSGELRVGLAAELRLDAHPDRVFRGRVSQLRLGVERRSWRDPSRIVQVELLLDEPDPEILRPGMRVQGTIEIEKMENRLVVPAAALKTLGEQIVANRRGLFQAGERVVRVGRRVDDWVEVLDGLDEGDLVQLY